MSKARHPRQRPRYKPAPVEIHLSIFFVDRNNYDALSKTRDASDKTAILVWDAVRFFIAHSPTGLCGVCQEILAGDELTFIVMITKEIDPNTLTSCICSACATRRDLDDEFEAIIRAWLPGAKRSRSTIVKQVRQTVH